MLRFFRSLPVLLMFSLLLYSCAHVDKRVVSIRYEPADTKGKVESKGAGFTVNDFKDVREERDIVGVDYPNAADIISREQVGVSVANVVGKVFSEKGYEVMRISRKAEPISYIEEFVQEFHLAGEVEKLDVRVKRDGILASISSEGQVHFSLYGSDGNLLWSGRLRSETSVSAAFGSEKGIEESLAESLKLIADGLLTDEKFIKAIGGN